MDHGKATLDAAASQLWGLRRGLLRVTGTVTLGAVVAAPAVASWHGLVTFGRQELALAGGLEYVVPISLDGAAGYAAWLAVRAVLAGDSAVWPRLLTLVYATVSAAFNAHAQGTAVSALFYAAMSLSAVVLWDTSLRAWRRDGLRALGIIEGPAARYRPLRWLFAPAETFAALKTAVLENVADPRAALAMVRGQLLADVPEPRDGDGQAAAGGSVAGGSVLGAETIEYEPLQIGSKAEAVRAAFMAIGSDDVPTVLAWLADRGVAVDRTYVYDLRRKWTHAAALPMVGGGSR
jgi:hypothetical protein